MPQIRTDPCRIATWSSPLTIQATLALLVLSMWLLGKWPFATKANRNREAVAVEQRIRRGGLTVRNLAA